MSGLTPEAGDRAGRAILSSYRRQIGAQFGADMSRRMRRLSLAIKAFTGRDGGGWFIPYRYARPGRRPGYPALEPLFAAARPAIQGWLDTMRLFRTELRAIPPGGPGLRWSQEWFSRLDAAAAYVVVRHCVPARIVEIGSGHSTRFMARAIADGRLTTTLTCIDPSPRAPLDGLAVRHIPALAEEVADVFDDLVPGDVLFIDSSHIAMPGTDVDHLLLGILPRLPVGVHVHIHDVFLPDPYPAGWSWRGYNEQTAVGALLQGGAYEIIFSSRYAATRMAEAVEQAVGMLPLLPDAYETSLWLTKARAV